ncbi:KN motif and ankyrin repeat domain-containing protein 1-like [Actinia tenebrosa]|uniref:KN motif and ankyrin repeat domain-containing protein 1-like n=1 Tax=Actinia tenebrosa TaxID=6105 RepID=A0A6P8H8M6_ACTTE|nr:KN motif and ankyrin repeat domain-containing protein 1-like [Actinia tenebrosa]
MSGRPFALKTKRRTRNTNSFSSDDGSSIRNIDRYDSDGESIGSDTDSIGSGFKNFPELDMSPSPRSLSPLSTSSTGASGSNSLSPLTFGFNMETLEFTQSEKPSPSLLEKSIASLPAGSDLKNTLLYIRKQLKHSLLRVKDLEEQVKCVPTLRVQNSVLQEEKRQLLKQLQSKCSMKKNRSYGYNDLYYNTLRQRGCKSDTEDDEDEFASVRRKLKMKLSGSTSLLNGNTDTDTTETKENVCERCKSGFTSAIKFNKEKLETFENIPHNRGTQTKIRGIDHTIWKSNAEKENDIHAKEAKDSSPRRKVSTRSIGVGMIRSFTKDCGVGSGIAELKTKDQTSQTFVEKTSVGCDSLVSESFDKGINVKPYMESCASQTERFQSPGYQGDQNKEVECIGTQTTIAEPYVSVGVGICTIDDDYCSRCLSDEEFITTKSVDEIMANRIDLPTYRSYGVGNGSLDDNYLCHRCWGVEFKEAACGDGKLTINDLFGSMKLQKDDTNKVAIDSKSKTTTKMNRVGISRLTDSVCVNCTSKRVRSVGSGSDSISELLCDRCINVKTRSIGAVAAPSVKTLGVGDCSVTDSFCDRCLNVRTKTVGVGECCLSDNYCDRCFQLKTKSTAVGDYDIDNTTGISIDNNDNFVGLSMRINGHVDKNDVKALVANKNSTYEGTDSSELSDGGNSTLTHVSDTVESDEASIDHDNPSSDSTGQMSEPSMSSSGQRSRVRLSEEVLSACKLLNGHLYKGKEIGREQLVSCMSTVENHWFECVTSPGCRADVIKAYVKAFRAYIPVLMETIINLRDKEGNNALHYAVSFNNWKVVNTILKTNFVDVGLPNQVGYNAVMLAALTGLEREEFTDIARRLLDLGDVNSKVEETGQTPLMLAVTRGRLDMVGLLLEAGADMNAQDNECSTALMCACEHGHANIARLLLSHPECNSILEDNEGCTALSIAMDRNYHDIALQIYGHSNFSYTGQRKKKLLV